MARQMLPAFGNQVIFHEHLSLPLHLLSLSTHSNMTKLALTLLCLLAASTSAEPPPSQYLPPGAQRPNQYLPPSQQYGPPGGGSGGFGGGASGGYSEDGGAPAKYEFEYMVNDPPSGSDFGHKESRDGDLTRGVYYVLLPDGRRQMVEYEADQNGYRPKITYVQVGSTGGGGAGGGAPGYQY